MGKSTEEMAKEAYEVWDLFGGKALGGWQQQSCREAWVAVVKNVLETLRDEGILDG